MLTLEQINYKIITLSNQTSMLMHQMNQECLHEQQLLYSMQGNPQNKTLNTRLRAELCSTKKRISALNTQIMQNNRKIKQLKSKFFMLKAKRLNSSKLV